MGSWIQWFLRVCSILSEICKVIYKTKNFETHQLGTLKEFMLCKLYFLLCCVWSCNNKWLKTFPFHILSVHPTTISLSAFFSAPFISPSFATSNIQRCSPSNRARTTNLQSMRSACSHYATLPVLIKRQNANNFSNAHQYFDKV